MLGLAFFMTVGGILLSKNMSNSGIKASESIKLETNKETTTIGETFQLALKEPEILKTVGEEETEVEEKKATIIPLSEGLSFDEQLTNQANDAQVDYTISWNEEKRQIEVVWLTQQNLNEVQLVVTGVTEGVYDIEASRLVGGMEEVSNKIVLSVTTPKATEENPIIRTPRIGNLNMDVDISPVTTSIASGTDAIYKLSLKTTGAMANYKNAVLVVELPDQAMFNQDLSELIIAGVQPEYDTLNRTLTYRFPELVTGQAYQVNIKATTLNGTTPNNKKLTAKVTLLADRFAEVTDTADVTVIASLPFSVTKSYVGVEGKDLATGPKPGDTIIWKIKATASSKATGLLFLKDNTKIIITDELIADLSYVGSTSTVTPTQVGKTVTWSFDAPTLEVQQQSLENSTELWSTEFLVKTKASSLISTDKTMTNEVSAKVTDFADVATDIKSNKASIGIALGGNIIEPPSGVWYYPTYTGPTKPYFFDGGYTLSPPSAPNPVPTVTDSAGLQFFNEYLISPYKEEVFADKEKKILYNWKNSEVYSKGYDYISINEEIDSNLILKSIVVQQPDLKARNDIPVADIKRPDIKVNIEVNTKGNWKSFKVSFIDHPIYKYPTTLTRGDMDLSSKDEVLSYNIVYENDDRSPIQGGFHVGINRGEYSIKKGYVGKVTNNIWYHGQVVGASTPFYRYPTNNDPATPIGPRSANVVNPNIAIPTVLTEVSLSKVKGGIIESGENRVYVALKNDKSSQTRVGNPINAVLLLPEGVKIKKNSSPDYQDTTKQKTSINATAAGGSYVVVSDNYNNTNRQLVRINWNDADILPNQYVAAWLDVEIANDAPSPLLPVVYGFSGDKEFTAPTVTGNSLTNSILEVDSDDLNGDGNTTKNRVKSSNSYYMLREGNVQTEKSVKGSEDSTFSKFGHTVPDGDIEYQLDLTNTTDEAITSFTLMDVLPSVGDLGITDGVNRESTFAPKMTGPIQVPEEWKDKVTVSYSTEANPKRDDLTKNVDYPVSTQKIENPASAADPKWMSEGSITDWSSISSFKIELKPSASWVKGQNIKLNFMMKAPSYEEITDKNLLNATIDEKSRAAWNSFAYAANRLQVVEPERVGVVMNELGKVRIQKVDSEDKNQTLEGASFVIAESEAQLKNGKTIKLDENGKLVYPSDDNYSDSMKDYQLTSTNKGILEFDKLRLGGVDGDTYYLKEVEAPKGYQLLTTYVKVTAAPEDSLVLIQVMNTKKVVMPQTGSMRIVLFIVLGLGLVGTGIVYYINKQGERVVGEAKRKK